MNNISTDNTEIKTLVVNAYLSAKALADYVKVNPGKLTDLKNEIKSRFGPEIKVQLMKLIF
jgi:hypothetical protein